MNINRIREATEKLIQGARDRAEAIGDKENQSDLDDTRISALEAFADALESELETLVSEYEG